MSLTAVQSFDSLISSLKVTEMDKLAKNFAVVFEFHGQGVASIEVMILREVSAASE